MTSRSKIVGLTRHLPDQTEPGDHSIASGSAEIDNDHAAERASVDVTDDAEAEYAAENVGKGRRWTAFIAPIMLGLTLIAWTGFFGWTYFDEVRAGLGAERVVALVGLWTVPALFTATLWLLFMRSSRAEADRFGDVARNLRDESRALEQRMRTVNEEIALARQFLAQNARELETVGRQSARQLTDAAEQLAAALADSDGKAKTLEMVSNAATSNLEQLRKHLPVVTSAAKDVTNQIGSAGSSAQMQVTSLIASLERVGEAGKTTRAYIDDMEMRAEQAGEKLAQAIAGSAATLTEATGSAEVRTGEMAALLAVAGDKLTTDVAAASAQIDDIVADSGSKLENYLAGLHSGIADLAALSSAEDARISRILSRISAHIEESAAEIAEVDAVATDQTAKLAFAISALDERTRDVGVALGNNQNTADRLLVSSDQLLLALESAIREIDETLPMGMDRIANRFAQNLEQIGKASSGVETIDQMSDKMLVKLTSLEHLIDVQRAGVERLMAESDANFAARHNQADALASALTQTRALIEDMTGTANDQLVNALLRVRETTRQAAESSRQILDDELANVADRLSEQNKSALSGAIDAQIIGLNDMIQSAIERNIAISAQATQKITAQLAEIDEMTSNVEQRIAETRDSFEGINDDSFARRMVLLTESLNSTAIDVAKIMSNDVTDTAWAAYLKGDRGVFTRRAVRLLDAGEARTIAEHYGNDSEFRGHVNRYIHDFEAMMRVLLSTRDGHAIGVTLLSSDVGKLYVALAQAIERLRA
jgi:hypothetical protein